MDPAPRSGRRLLWLALHIALIVALGVLLHVPQPLVVLALVLGVLLLLGRVALLLMRRTSTHN